MSQILLVTYGVGKNGGRQGIDKSLFRQLGFIGVIVPAPRCGAQNDYPKQSIAKSKSKGNVSITMRVQNWGFIELNWEAC